MQDKEIKHEKINVTIIYFSILIPFIGQKSIPKNKQLFFRILYIFLLLKKSYYGTKSICYCRFERSLCDYFNKLSLHENNIF